MKKTFLLILALNLFSCSTTKNKVDTTSVTNTKSNNYKIYNISASVGDKTVSYNELRFYSIDSALDTMKSMYLEFGEWNKKANGLYQDNISRKIWENVKLFENEKSFTIIADGTETLNDYFASLVILDSDGRDCLKDQYPLKDEIINLFTQKMNKNRGKKVNYLILKK